MRFKTHWRWEGGGVKNVSPQYFFSRSGTSPELAPEFSGTGSQGSAVVVGITAYPFQGGWSYAQRPLLSFMQPPPVAKQSDKQAGVVMNLSSEAERDAKFLGHPIPASS
jgi:hypothetical protein